VRKEQTRWVFYLSRTTIYPPNFWLLWQARVRKLLSLSGKGTSINFTEAKIQKLTSVRNTKILYLSANDNDKTPYRTCFLKSFAQFLRYECPKSYEIWVYLYLAKTFRTRPTTLHREKTRDLPLCSCTLKQMGSSFLPLTWNWVSDYHKSVTWVEKKMKLKDNSHSHWNWSVKNPLGKSL